MLSNYSAEELLSALTNDDDVLRCLSVTLGKGEVSLSLKIRTGWRTNQNTRWLPCCSAYSFWTETFHCSSSIVQHKWPICYTGISFLTIWTKWGVQPVEKLLRGFWRSTPFVISTTDVHTLILQELKGQLAKDALEGTNVNGKLQTFWDLHSGFGLQRLC